MPTKLWAVLLVIFCTLLTSSAQILLKFGALGLPAIFSNVPLIIGMLIYGIAAFALIISFKGGEVTVLYPIIATSYVWVTLLSRFYFGEPLIYLKFIGVFAIIVGICFIGFGSKNTDVEFAVAP